MPTAVQPDIEAVLTAYLSGYTALTALSASVGTQLPDSSTQPALVIVVTRLGGPVDFPGWVDRPRVQVESWGVKKKTAHDGMAAARAGMLDLPGVHGGAVITGVDELNGPQWFPDATVDPARPRYFAVYALTSHPVPTP